MCYGGANPGFGRKNQPNLPNRLIPSNAASPEPTLGAPWAHLGTCRGGPVWCREGQSVPATGIRRKELLEFFRHAVPILAIGWRLAFHGDIGPAFGVLRVDFQPLFEPVLGIRLDGLGGALRLANAAIDALVRVDDEHILALIKAVHRTDLNAVHVFAFNTVFDDDVGHSPLRTTNSKCCLSYR